MVTVFPLRGNHGGQSDLMRPDDGLTKDILLSFAGALGAALLMIGALFLAKIIIQA